MASAAAAIALTLPSFCAAEDAPQNAAPDAAVAAMVARVSAARIRSTDEHLVGFGTRNLFSETLQDPKRGVYAARDWLAAQFREIANESGGRMTVSLDTYVQAKTPETPRAVEVSSVIRASDDSFRVAWIERRYVDDALTTTERWSAILTVVIQTPTNADRLKVNPLGVYVRALNWSKEL